MTETYYSYWGKAEKDGVGYHLLPYHCSAKYLQVFSEKVPDGLMGGAARPEPETGFIMRCCLFVSP